MKLAWVRSRGGQASTPKAEAASACSLERDCVQFGGHRRLLLQPLHHYTGGWACVSLWAWSWLARFLSVGCVGASPSPGCSRVRCVRLSGCLRGACVPRGAVCLGGRLLFARPPRRPSCLLLASPLPPLPLLPVFGVLDAHAAAIVLALFWPQGSSRCKVRRPMSGSPAVWIAQSPKVGIARSLEVWTA